MMNVWSILAALFSGAVGAMGLGGGGVLVLYLTLSLGMEQLQAQGINLIFFLPCAAISIAIQLKRKMIDLPTAGWMALGGSVGVLGGMWLTKILHGALLSKIFAVFLIVVGLMELFGKAKKSKNLDRNRQN